MYAVISAVTHLLKEYSIYRSKQITNLCFVVVFCLKRLFYETHLHVNVDKMLKSKIVLLSFLIYEKCRHNILENYEKCWCWLANKLQKTLTITVLYRIKLLEKRMGRGGNLWWQNDFPWMSNKNSSLIGNQMSSWIPVWTSFLFHTSSFFYSHAYLHKSRNYVCHVIDLHFTVSRVQKSEWTCIVQYNTLGTFIERNLQKSNL